MAISANDIQHIVAVMYAAMGDFPKEVIEGDRVLDSKAKERRDVDVTVIRTDRMEVLAVEVKAKGRTLGTDIVEGLCCKLGDMPAVTTKAIVSLSGFSGPAVRKAAAHGVVCLTLKRGRLPAFNVDLTQLREIEVNTPEWETGPHVRFVTRRDLTTDERALFGNKTRVVYPPGGPPSITAEELRKRMVASVELRAPLTAEIAPVAIRLAITDSPRFRIRRNEIEIDAVEVTGMARRNTLHVPITDTFFLADPTGAPLGGAAVVEADGELISLGVAHDTGLLYGTLLPAKVRRKRATRRRIYPA